MRPLAGFRVNTFRTTLHLNVKHLWCLFLSTATLCCVAVCAHAQSRTAKAKVDDEPVYFNFQNREVLAPTLLSTERLSVNGIGSVSTILFDEARLSLQNAGDPQVGTWIGTVRLPINKVSGRTRSYRQDVRGSVTKDVDCKASIGFWLAGSSHVIQFPYGKKLDRNFFRRFVSVSSGAHPDQYVATVVISVERRKPTAAVLIQLDSIEVEARMTPKK